MTVDRRATLLAVLLPLVVLHAGILRGGVYFQNDVQLMWMPGTQAIAEALLSGSWPFWNPRVGFGEPLLANANNQVFYPPAWPGLLLPPAFAYSLLVLVHHAWLAVGAGRLARETGQSRAASLVVAALAAAAGPVVSLVPVWNQLCGFAWVPWAGVAMLRAVRTGSLLGVVAAGACVAAAVLAGSPEAGATAVLVALVAALSGAWKGRRLAPLAAWVAAALLGAALSAPQWLTTLDAARGASRSRLPAASRLASSVHPLVLPNLAVAVDVAGQPLDTTRRLEVLGAWDPLIVSPYVGAATLVLAALALSRRTLTLALAAAVLTALLVSLGPHGPLGPLAHLPGVGLFRYPSKALILVALAVPLLAGLGWDRAARLSRRQVLARAGGAAALVGVAFAAAALTLDVPVAGLLRPAAPGLAAAAAVVALVGQGGTRARAAAGLLAALDLLVAHAGLHATAPAALYRLRPSLVERVRAAPEPRLCTWDYFVYGAARRHLGQERGYELVRAPAGWHEHAAQAFGLRVALYPPTATAWGISGSYDADIPGLGSLAVQEVRELLRGVENTPAHTTLLRLGAVSHVAALHQPPGLAPVAVDVGLFRQPVRLFAVPDPLPRARVVDGVAPSRGPVGLLDPDWDMARSVQLEHGTARPADPAFRGGARVLARGADAIVVETSASAGGHLVLADAFDAGWSAEVDGRPVAPRRANHAFLAVPVPAGDHRVTLRYWPRGLTAGLVAAAAGLLVAAVVGGWRLSAGTALRAGSGPSLPR